MPRFQVQTVTIPLSGTLSGIVDIRGDGPLGVLLPGLTSAQVFVLGNTEATSAGFAKLWKADGSSTYVLTAGAGSVTAQLDEVARAWPFLRLETSVAQAAARTLTFVVKIV